MIRSVGAAIVMVASLLSAPATAPTPQPVPSSPSSSAAAEGDCAVLTAPPPQQAPPTTVNTLRQAYYCVLDNYYSGPAMDPRTPLKDAFSAYTRDLLRRGADRPGLQLPALTGNRDTDWAALAKVLGAGDATALRAAIAGIVAGLRDNHARLERPSPPPEGGPTGMGIMGASAMQGPQLDPAARPPLFITSVLPGSPAAKADVRPGDIVLKVNGVPVFVGDAATPGILEAFNAASVRLTLKRPTTGRVRTVRITRGPITLPPLEVTAKTLREGVTYVRLPGFFPGGADQVIAKLRGASGAVVLDLRGNGGGSPREVTRLLGAFVHGKVTSYFCPLTGECAPNRTDDTVPLLGLRLVVLTDRGCASACEDFSAAVHDLDLGPLVGTRTGGAISGPSAPYGLDDGSVLLLPKVRHLGPAREIIDTVGVPVDHYAPMTALDLASGRDPAVTKALSLL
ncbi:S41 family peptidase [Sphaerisporangium sp. NPDC051011]|uniref:S41 family peptidase n=1 Tax=Sphaerisporangium sp. NPDC051011 TaxID=3155792 RepID=UPI0034041C3B